MAASNIFAEDLNTNGTSDPSPATYARARATRPEVVGSYAPERPYPLYLRGVVEKGFGRGGKDLGCPTANLPSKVIQSNPHLQRTGIYFGFARVLPQDPDDPDLVDDDEDAGKDAGGSSSSYSGQQGSGQGVDYGDDDVNVETDEDGDEVVLSASPVHEEGEPDLRAWTEAQSGSFVIKPRQLSKSSARSSRSVKTILEKAGALGLERTLSGNSGAQPATSDSSPSPLSPSTSAADASGLKSTGAAKLRSPQQLSPNSAPESSASATTSAQGTQPSSSTSETPSDRQHRQDSSASSRTGSLRQKKKRRIPITSQDARIYPMVMSVGWNPFYKNTTKTAEVHIIHPFSSDFYGLEMRVVVLGYIRPEYNYVSKEALIADIETDKHVAVNSLDRSPYQDYVTDPFLMAPS